MSRPKVIVTDYVFRSLEIEHAVLGAVGAEIVAMQAASEAQLLARSRTRTHSSSPLRRSPAA